MHIFYKCMSCIILKLIILTRHICLQTTFDGRSGLAPAYASEPACRPISLPLATILAH